MARMIGWRLWIQTSRSLATSERARSSASRVFFIAEPGLAQKPRQRCRINLDAMPGLQLSGQLGHGDVGRFPHASHQEVAVGRELAGARRTALPLRPQYAGAAMARHQLDRERRAHLQIRCRTATRSAAVDPGNDPPAQVQRVASPHDPPPSTVNYSSPIWGIPDSNLKHDAQSEIVPDGSTGASIQERESRSKLEQPEQDLRFSFSRHVGLRAK